MSYQFVHFNPLKTPLSADESLSSVPGSLVSDVQSLSSSDSSGLPSSEGDSHVCDKHKKNGKDKIYSVKTGMTGLQYHLIKDHLQLWVSACDKMGVLVKGAGIKAAERFHCQNGTARLTEEPLPADSFVILEYSHDAFVDAIIEWIIVDD
ncbi:uncharacterized protein EV420DRAFT_1648418 [Desarmillaria tabescens]|uniref:Uncharacterized protein n=1 Tax=Armillaria tabescens TaxID=1929756 RepID=A0AA39MTJ3_ARMTA|nr:uncharacterized protein EV420DRAFT_1648418 [Desarmillaria tabescens]KAK0445280.1 hypothetical protein EV420DRAFT_1648418 [Desarmillaria tabescens]